MDLERIDIDSIILALHGLNPALPWKEYGLFGDSTDNRDRISRSLLQEMDDQIHQASLLTSAASRELAVETGDASCASMLR
eukprot:3396718-Rhodomonas_salina.1